MKTLLQNQTANTDGTQATSFHSGANDGRDALLMVSGTFDGATIGIEVRAPGESEWVPVTESQFTAQADPLVVNGGGFHIRGALSSAGSSTDLTLKLVGRK